MNQTKTKEMAQPSPGATTLTALPMTYLKLNISPTINGIGFIRADEVHVAGNGKFKKISLLPSGWIEAVAETQTVYFGPTSVEYALA